MKGGNPEDTPDAPWEEAAHFHPLHHTIAAEVVVDFEEGREASCLLDEEEKDIGEDNSAVQKLAAEEPAPDDNAVDEADMSWAADRMEFPSIVLDAY